jgi:hypothetical protein
MRTWQNSASSTVPELGISRGAPLPRRRKRLIENVRLRSKLSSNNSSRLQISNRERTAISRRPVSFFSSFDPQAPGLESLIENANASSIGILSDQRESKDLSYRPLRHQRSQLLIANLELEFQLTGCGTNHMQTSNRKFSAIFHCGFPSPGSSRLIIRHSLGQSGLGAREGPLMTALPWPPCCGPLIETRRLEFPVTPTKTAQYKILIGTKTAFLEIRFSSRATCSFARPLRSPTLAGFHEPQVASH